MFPGNGQVFGHIDMREWNKKRIPKRWGYDFLHKDTVYRECLDSTRLERSVEREEKNKKN